MNTVRTTVGESTDEESNGARKVAVVTGAGSGIGRAVAV
ncbi:oxidoreductase, partial [Streptomyces coelicoflavus ZG0656]